MPHFIPPQLAILRSTIPSATGWVHEVKFDGYRLQTHLNDGGVTIYTRSGLDWTGRFPTVANAVERLPASKLILDGEVVSAEPSGRTDFSALQDDLKSRRYDRMAFYAFDILHLDGFDLRAAPLTGRKTVLATFLGEADTTIMHSEHFEDGGRLFESARELGLEGIVSKRGGAPYRSGRDDAWQKVKCNKRDRFVVVGFAPEGSVGLAKLRVARLDGDNLVYVGRVGTGWDRKKAAAIRKALAPLSSKTCPLTKPIRRKDTTWVEPVYVADVQFTEITSDGMLRHPSFKGFERRDG